MFSYPTNTISNLQLLQLRSQPFLRRGNRLLNLLWLRTRALARRLLATSLTTNDLRDSGGPFLSGDALGCEVLFVDLLVFQIHTL